MSSTAKGVLLKILSTVAFAVMVVLIKLVSARVPPGEVLFFRAGFGTIPVLVMLMWQGEFPRSLRTSHPFGHVRRAATGTVSMFCWFASLSYLPLPDATAINYAGPLFGTLFAALLLKETVRVYRWTAVAVGFCGVLIVLSGQISGSVGGLDHDRLTGGLLALSSAIFAALAMVSVRSLTATETTGAIVFYFSASAAAMALLSLPFGWVVPLPWDAAALVLAGLAGGVGQVLMTSAYRYAEASAVAPFDYVNMLWIVAAAYFVFGDVPTATVLAGSAIVIGSSIFVVLRERRLGIERARGAAAPGGQT